MPRTGCLRGLLYGTTASAVMMLILLHIQSKEKWYRHNYESTYRDLSKSSKESLAFDNSRLFEEIRLNRQRRKMGAHGKRDRKPKQPYFRQILNREQKEILLGLLKQLAEVLDEHEILYMMYGGTLLGSYR